MKKAYIKRKTARFSFTPTAVKRPSTTRKTSRVWAKTKKTLGLKRIANSKRYNALKNLSEIGKVFIF